jgi:hypothetical protein
MKYEDAFTIDLFCAVIPTIRDMMGLPQPSNHTDETEEQAQADCHADEIVVRIKEFLKGYVVTERATWDTLKTLAASLSEQVEEIHSDNE